MLLLLASPLHAFDLDRLNSQLTHRVWNTQDGLPSDALWDVLVADDGFVWFASEGGLVRFDGVDFKVFNSLTSDAFTVDDTRSIAMGADGSLWAGTYGGGVVHLSGDQVRRYASDEGLDNPVVYEVFVASDGTVWAGTASSACRLIAEHFECFDADDGLGSNRIFGISQASSRTLWFASIDSGVSSFDGRKFVNYSTESGLDSRQIFSIASDTEFDVIVGTYRGKFFTLEGERFVPVEFEGLPDGATPVTYFRDRHDNIWMGSTTHGLLRAHPEFRRVDEEGVDALQVFAITEGDAGGLWLATASGLHHYSAPAFVPWGVDEGLANTTFVLDEAPDGSIWSGTERDGLYRLGPDGSHDRFWVDDGLPASSISSILIEPDGLVWVGTFTSGVVWLREGRVIGTLGQSDGLASSQITAMYRSDAGTVWIGTAAGLHRFANGVISHRLSADDGLVTDLVRFISEDASGKLLISTDRGLVVVDPENVEVVDVLNRSDGLGSDIVATSYVDERGVIWVGGRSGGLTRIKSGSAFHFTPEHQLGIESVMGIVEDASGYLWLGGRSGISRILREQLDSVAEGRATRVDTNPITLRDGVRAARVPGGFQSPMILARDGRIWMATSKGLAVVDPRAITTRKVALNVTIDTLSADGEPVNSATGFVVPAGTQAIQIGYSVALPANGEALRFRYRLVDVDGRWQEAGTRRTAFFTSLSPGDYELQVQARLNGQVFPEFFDTTGFRFSVAPVWYQTAVARLLAAFVVLALLWLIYQYLLSNYRLREQRLESLVAERTGALSTALEEVQRLSRIDSLTQVANRRHFQERLDEVWELASENAEPVSVMILDIDYFKSFNDRAGHQEGDRVLTLVAQTLAKSVRDEDFVARFGGEEFIILLSGSNTDDAAQVAQRVQLAIRDLQIDHPALGGGAVVTVSAGFASAQPDQIRESEALIKRADEALYRAKADGRDRLEMDADNKWETGV